MNDAKDFENEVALRDFLLDIECLDELLPWTRRVNLFDTINEQIRNVAQFFARFETFSIRKIKKYLDFRFINK